MKSLVIRIRDQKLIAQITEDAGIRKMAIGDYCREVLQNWFAFKRDEEIREAMIREIAQKTAMVESNRNRSRGGNLTRFKNGDYHENYKGGD